MLLAQKSGLAKSLQAATIAATLLVVPVALKAAESKFLPEGSVNAVDLIPPAPTLDSPEFQTQMEIVEWAQQTRTDDDVAFVEQTLNVDRFWPIIGADLFSVDARGLKDVIDQSIDEVRADYDALKSVYDLPRPFQVNEVIDPVGDARPVASYPSGHSIRAIVYARLLSEVFPQHEAELMELAHQVGYGRVMAGVHYPVDVVSGQALGHAYSDAILANSKFHDAVIRISTEQSVSNCCWPSQAEGTGGSDS
ncbi:phosphatase PAP2 family protein [Ruegeria lacuscaerulensis]|uniref:phosphatase PAP2 family protein n=1 Tax=Ruegeria lacuscaerulensis TaxID=55218 RepID=UPI001479A805|nr:phosphatase PAP2 family protein [Ruegeria lacuscaerulensis]